MTNKYDLYGGLGSVMTVIVSLTKTLHLCLCEYSE